MARVCPLFSSSSGNSTYIKDGDSAILIDAGVSFKRLKEAAEKSGGNIENISAVAVTHEHTDHIAGLKVLLKTLKVPLIASEKTLETLIAANAVPENTECIAAAECTAIGDFGISRFSTSHDCDGSSGYSVFLPSGIKVSVCTDLGIVTDEVRNAISKSDCLLFESNHDITMLKNGPYPPQLKLRILSELGHLSNNACAAELPALLNSGTTRFVLGHLSMHNNLPMLAKSAARASLGEVGAVIDSDYILTVAKPADNGVIVL